jgi:hypothetical protein
MKKYILTMLRNLEIYMNTNKNIIKWTNNIFEQKKKFIEKKEKIIKKIVEKSSYIHIHKKDPLFWCFFYILHGEFTYNMNHNDFSTEKLQKIDFIKKVRENKDLLKKHKFKKNYIEDQLLNMPYINLQTFFCLCILNNISFIVKEGTFYWTHIYNEQNIYIINKEKDKIYIYENEKKKEEEINNIKKNCIQTFNLHKKIKTISNYKMDELTTIAKKLNINMYKENGKKKIKKNIYSEIQKYI